MAKRRWHTTRLSQHKRNKKLLIPPLMALNLNLTQWNRDTLPEMLLLDAIWELGDVNGPKAFNALMNVLENFVADKTQLWGTITSLEYISNQTEAVSAIKEIDLYDAIFSQGLLHALALFPKSPGYWLVSDWASTNHVDWEQGEIYLKDAVTRLFDAKGPRATHCQMLVISRMLKSGKFKVSRDVWKEGTLQLFPKYPHDLNEEEKQLVEAASRSMFGAIAMINDLRDSEWVKHFWRKCYTISPCVFLDETIQSESEPEILDDFNSILGALQQITERFKSLIEVGVKHSEIDVYDLDKSEVMFGIVSRQYSLYQKISRNVDHWAMGSSMIFLRSMADSYINAKWMISHGEDDVYNKFKLYSIGNTKLHKLKVEELIDQGKEYLEPLANDLQGLISDESSEEFINIDLGSNFDGPNIRQKAIDSDLKELYDLVYSPASSEVHGEWVNLKTHNLQRCRNPLHRFHFVPHLVDYSYVSASPMLLATDLLADTIMLCMNALNTKYVNLESDLSIIKNDTRQIMIEWSN